MTELVHDRPIFVISDLHMGDGGPRDNFALKVAKRVELLNGFLDHVQKQSGELIICGDFFDFWQASVGRVMVTALPLLGRLGEMQATYILGNHDADLAALIGRNLLSHPFFGAMSGPVERRIGAKRFKFVHGHEIDEFNSDETPSWGRMMTIFAGICEDKNGSPMMGEMPVEDVLTFWGELALKGFKWVANSYAKTARARRRVQSKS
jgi:UDP-2,3-diacylglucosamine pyrophosphatase LpxH